MLIPNPPELVSGLSFVDKIEHFLAFFILNLLFIIWLNGGEFRRFTVLALSAVILAIYGALMELLQHFTGRTAEFADFIADLAGIVAGGLLSLFFL
jgi:VanZ family protein